MNVYTYINTYIHKHVFAYNLHIRIQILGYTHHQRLSATYLNRCTRVRTDRVWFAYVYDHRCCNIGCSVVPCRKTWGAGVETQENKIFVPLSKKHHNKKSLSLERWT